MPPPVSSAGTTSRVLIDLTESDDDERIAGLSAPDLQNRSSHASSIPHSVPISRNGAILPGTLFNPGTVNNGVHGVRNNSGDIPRKFEEGQLPQFISTGSSRLHAAQTQLPQVKGGSSARRSTGQQTPRPIASQEYRNSEPYPAKRRRIQDVTITRVLPRQPSVQYAPILPPVKAIPVLRPLRLPSETKSAAPPENQEDVREKIQDNEQAPLFDQTHTSRNSFPPPPKIDTAKADEEKRLQELAELYSIVDPAIQKYQSKLIQDNKDKIATGAVKKLISDSDPSVSEHFRSNSFTIEYKKELAAQAATYVDNIADAMLKERNLPPQGSFDLRISHKETINKSYIKSDDLDRNRRSTSGSTTVEEEPVFEGSTKLKRGLSIPSHSRRTQRRHYSSSPTTSYSTDHQMEGVNPAENEVNLTTVPSAQDISTVPQAKPPRRIVGGKPSQIRASLSKVGYKSKYTTSQLAAIREAQALRYAAQDDKMPRPYISFKDREDIRRGLELLPNDQSILEQLRKYETSIYHLDFTLEEMDFLCGIVRAIRGGIQPAKVSFAREIVTLMKYQEFRIDRICAIANTSIRELKKGTDLLRLRGEAAIRAFLLDAAAGNIPKTPQFYSILPSVDRERSLPKPRILSLLAERQTWGMAPLRVGHGDQPLEVEFSSYLEDQLTIQSEWTDCCGDISTLCWTSDQTFVCGATAHSDFHNMQYNKPGNLLVGSISHDTLKSISDHRIVRPVIGSQENAENSLESMRQTQAPWLYTSVVSTAHSDLSGFTFTASFDGTVKVWKVSHDGSSMDLNATWHHDGRVNFVVTSEHHKRVATASDVVHRAIRVYNLDQSSVQDSPYDIYDCDKAMAQAQEPFRRDTWAYFPASIAWGKALGVANFLLVGYSPRSLTAHESEIPEDKRNSGEICLWNVEDGEAILITSAKTQNVFEVLWHPTQPIFLAATSPAGIYDLETKTQIRLFAQNEHGSFTHIKALDCKASDINELTIMPNSTMNSYVTASCTDGNCYVWDTAQGDRPIHILGHGESLDNPIHDIPREDADTGVKFASWGQKWGRFYTGSSDGKVKAWDIQAPRHEAFVRTVLKLSGGISAGSFSKDFSKLIIGDATGKVHLLGIKDEDLDHDGKTKSARVMEKLSVSRNPQRFAAPLPIQFTRRAPKVIIPHPEPAPPAGYDYEIEIEQSAADIARLFIEEGQITLHPNRMIGAVKGPNYDETLLYRLDGHEDNDGTKPLKAEWQARQQCEVLRNVTDLEIPSLPILHSSNPANHANNASLDLDFSRLSLSTQQQLQQDRVDFGFDNEHTFDYELSPRKKIYRGYKEHIRKSTSATGQAGPSDMSFEV